MNAKYALPILLPKQKPKYTYHENVTTDTKTILYKVR